MYPHVFLPHWIKGFWYNFLHPPLFCGTDKNWDGGRIMWLERVGRRAYGLEIFQMGEETPEDTMIMLIEQNFVSS